MKLLLSILAVMLLMGCIKPNKVYTTTEGAKCLKANATNCGLDLSVCTTGLEYRCTTNVTVSPRGEEEDNEI